jgi:hypothetical protein
MSIAKISGSEYTVSDLFSNKFAFSIPDYQRPYAWTTEHAKELFEDLISSLGPAGANVQHLNPYFLGSIVVIKGDSPDSEVVDGQQRLTTLTILFSVLREFVTNETLKQNLTNYIYQQENLAEGKPERFRLALREQDASFFREEIQRRVNKVSFLEKDVEGKTDSHKNLILNAQLYIKAVRELPENERIRLIQFITTRCYVILVSSPDITSAYRIFSILNDRGLPLSHTDILKAEILGKIPDGVRDEYRHMWEQFEDNLSRDGFANLFGHIRMVYRRIKPQDTVLKEFLDHVNPTIDPISFMNNILKPYSQAYEAIRKSEYQHATNAPQINRLFEWLNRIDNADWLPTALYFLSEKSNYSDVLLKFYTALERIAAGMMVMRYSVNDRIERYAAIMHDIEKVLNNEKSDSPNKDINLDYLYRPESPLQLTPQECNDIIRVLDGDVYNQTRTRLYILLRLDDALSDPEQPDYNFNIITVEHVLPQNPKPSSEWLITFPNPKLREDYTNRIGNLALLSRGKNSTASNRDFQDKKLTYFTKKVSPFALTMKVLGEAEWTPKQLEERQQEAITTLKKVWQL